MYALLFELPRALERVLGLGSRESGLVLGAMMISMVVAGPVSGRLSDRAGARPVALGGALLCLGGMLLMLALPIRSAGWVVPGMIVLGLGLGITSAPSQAAAISDAPRESSGMAAALLSTMRYLGGVAGIVALGLVQSDRTDPAIALAEHRTALVLFAVALGLAAACTLVLPRGVGPRHERG
jgi:MFS family permease